MKKLMIACVAVAIAAVAQAATINWSIMNVYSPADSTAKVAANSMSAWLFVTANSTDVTTIKTTTLAAVQAVLDSGDLTGLSSLAAASGVNTTAAGSIAGATGLTGFSSGSLTAFAVVVDSTTLADAENYFLVSGGEAKTATFTSATGAKMLGFGDQTSYTQGAGKWTAAAPEPTSGLLLLLGMAGLALKRKVA